MKVTELFDLTDRTAVVTGGAQGLGEEMAHALAEAGADVAVADLKKQQAEGVAADLRGMNRRSMAVEVDVADEASVAWLVTAVKDAWGHIDILVNAAGIVNNVCAETVTTENWERVVKVDLTGTFLTNTAVGREMIRQKSGSIINISSMSGIISNCPQPQCHYNAAKAGVAMLTKSLAAEWAQHNVRVNALAPGYMKTELVLPVLDRYLEHWLPRVPMGRIGEPWEIKGPVVFLASSASSYLTGAVIVMDGGYTCW